MFRVFAGNDKIGRSLARGALRAASLSHQPILAHVYQHIEAELFVQKRVQGLKGFTETLAAAGYPVKHGTSSLKLTGRKIT